MFSIAVDARNTLGECPLWCDKTRRLFWTDIEGSELLAFEGDSNAVTRWSLPERLGSFALTEKTDVMLMGLASRIGFYDLNTRSFTELVSSPGESGTRIGDGRCDRSGNYVFGTMDDGDPLQSIGKFHRLNAATLCTDQYVDITTIACKNGQR
ncbi:SMP-30/Gluconolaconase/LRE-like region-containing protein [Aeromonas sp. RU39B]|uniref:SMP-30/gluconolactonase/LRE family protein n=1 Tax=Aeromonas sp. RU39B TaxID=1907416 RepID=UPI0009544E89|nr:SMP-30/gluconolactonase/LRE family protein [Aeromonas sp. RU39B]SIQ77819.1 SMP-30/Gluconolaconase/LRE-like region-containing protein [Aeromonas sp. RU39B]